MTRTILLLFAVSWHAPLTGRSRAKYGMKTRW